MRKVMFELLHHSYKVNRNTLPQTSLNQNRAFWRYCALR
jgi:hypothetical protein